MLICESLTLHIEFDGTYNRGRLVAKVKEHRGIFEHQLTKGV